MLVLTVVLVHMDPYGINIENAGIDSGPNPYGINIENAGIDSGPSPYGISIENAVSTVVLNLSMLVSIVVLIHMESI